MEFPDFGSSEFDNVSQLEYPTFCFLFPASNGRGVNYGQGTGDSGTGHWMVDNGTDIGIGDVGQDIGRWTLGLVMGQVMGTGHWTVDNGTDLGTGDVGQDIGW